MADWYCPKCDFKNRDSNKTCTSCGTVRPGATVPKTEVPTPGWICPECNHKNSSSYTKCFSCGYMRYVEPEPKSGLDMKINGKTALICIAIASVLIVGKAISSSTAENNAPTSSSHTVAVSTSSNNKNTHTADKPVTQKSKTTKNEKTTTKKATESAAALSEEEIDAAIQSLDQFFSDPYEDVSVEYKKSTNCISAKGCIESSDYYLRADMDIWEDLLYQAQEKYYDATRIISYRELDCSLTLDLYSDTDSSKKMISFNKNGVLSTDIRYHKATKGEENALKKALDYLDYSAFSYDRLIEQLEYEKFSHSEAVYAADNCGADWDEQAEKKAKQYLEFSSFSYDGLVDQLEYEGFTHSQAVHGADVAYN